MYAKSQQHSASKLVSFVRKHVFAIALVAGALVASSSKASAQQASSPDPGVRCAAKVGPGQYEFYLPGEKATDINGNKWVCGPDGQWFRDYSSLTTVGGTYTKYPLHLVYQVVQTTTAVFR